MEYVDLTQAVQKTLQASPPPKREYYDHAQAHRLRSKMLGVLIRRSRLAAERSLEDCGQVLHVGADEIEAWEMGKRSPSLPQLERLAACFISGGSEVDVDRDEVAPAADDEYFGLRRRIISVQLQLARLAQERSLEELCALTGLEVAVMRRYECGEACVPVHHLTMLAQVLGYSLSHFAHTESVGRAAGGKTDPEQPPAEDDEADLKDFAADARNRAFIRLAMAFRGISRDDLQSIADALCVIIKQRRAANGRMR